MAVTVIESDQAIYELAARAGKAFQRVDEEANYPERIDIKAARSLGKAFDRGMNLVLEHGDPSEQGGKTVFTYISDKEVPGEGHVIVIGEFQIGQKNSLTVIRGKGRSSNRGDSNEIKVQGGRAEDGTHVVDLNSLTINGRPASRPKLMKSVKPIVNFAAATVNK